MLVTACSSNSRGGHRIVAKAAPGQNLPTIVGNLDLTFDSPLVPGRTEGSEFFVTIEPITTDHGQRDFDLGAASASRGESLDEGSNWDFRKGHSSARSPLLAPPPVAPTPPAPVVEPEVPDEPEALEPAPESVAPKKKHKSR